MGDAAAAADAAAADAAAADAAAADAAAAAAAAAVAVAAAGAFEAGVAAAEPELPRRHRLRRRRAPPPIPMPPPPPLGRASWGQLVVVIDETYCATKNDLETPANEDDPSPMGKEFETPPTTAVGLIGGGDGSPRPSGCSRQLVTSSSTTRTIRRRPAGRRPTSRASTRRART